MCLQYLHSAWFLDGRNQYLLCMYVALIWIARWSTSKHVTGSVALTSSLNLYNCPLQVQYLIIPSTFHEIIEAYNTQGLTHT